MDWGGVLGFKIQDLGFRVLLYTCHHGCHIPYHEAFKGQYSYQNYSRLRRSSTASFMKARVSNAGSRLHSDTALP